MLNLIFLPGWIGVGGFDDYSGFADITVPFGVAIKSARSSNSSENFELLADFVWDSNTILHEWESGSEADLTTWVFEEGTRSPSKLPIYRLHEYCLPQ